MEYRICMYSQLLNWPKYPSDGDAYDMDGEMQLSYEHCLPKKSKNSSHRFAIVFRNGEEGCVRLVRI